MQNKNCYCCSGKTFQSCCEPYLLGIQNAFSPETLMRSRYSAFATHHGDYLLETTHYSTRKNHTKAAILEWATTNEWIKLEVLHANDATVEFKAHYRDQSNQTHIHHEFSTFKKENDNWYFVDGTFVD